MFGMFFKPDKRIEELEKRVTELESGIVACVKLMKLQSEAMGSLANEVVNLSNAMKLLTEKKSPSVKSKNEDYFH
jgi:uncharacterized coiled-coil protein SlyX